MVNGSCSEATWIDYREGPENRNMFSADLDRPPEAWCQDFVQFVSASAGYKQPYATAAVVGIGHWAQQHAMWIPSTKATPGCQICYDWNNGDGREPIDWQETHTGLYIGGGRTIEGNTGSPQGVWQKSITLGAANIWGAIDWPRYWAGDGRARPMSGGNRFAGYPTIRRGSKGDPVKTFQRHAGPPRTSEVIAAAGRRLARMVPARLGRRADHASVYLVREPLRPGCVRHRPDRRQSLTCICSWSGPSYLSERPTAAADCPSRHPMPTHSGMEDPE